jgi:hypothetical protein
MSQGLSSACVLASWLSSTSCRFGVVGVAMAIALGGCSFLEDLDPLQTGAGGAGPATSSSTTTSSSGGGGSGGATSSTSSSGGAGGEGGSIDPCGTPIAGRLVDCGLVARYFLDEAASGTSPVAVLDATPNPLHLPTSYLNQLAYTEDAGHRGLRWPVAGVDGGPAAAVAGTKLQGFDGATTLTIEVVVDIEQATSSTSRICNLGAGPYSAFALGADLPEVVEDVPVIGPPIDVELRGRFTTADYSYARFPVALGQLGRVVLHAVIDTSESVRTDRMRLYVNGTREPIGELYSDAGAGNGPAQGEALFVADTETFSIGNRTLGSRSPEGAIYYTALYGHALGQAQITHNALELLASDDAP